MTVPDRQLYLRQIADAVAINENLIYDKYQAGLISSGDFLEQLEGVTVTGGLQVKFHTKAGEVGPRA